MSDQSPRACWCVISHPQTPEERADVVSAMDYARLIGDLPAILLCAAMLIGPCPAWEAAADAQGGGE